MAIAVSFGNTKKRRNSTMVPPVSQTFQCVLKEATSILNPVIQLEYQGFPDWNYCYISEFHRYYYISDVVSITAWIWELSCEVDVLATYSNEIKATPAFIMYAESKGYPMIPDNRLPITDSFSSEAAVIQTFPIYSDSGTYILSIISKGSSGNSGYAKVFAMTASELSALADRMLDPSILDAVKDYFLGNPADAVVSCTWIPVGFAYVGQGSSEITAYGNELGLSGTTAIPMVSGDISISVPLKYVDRETGSWQDYRNFEPYSKYMIVLPGVGEVELPMISLASQIDGGTSVSLKLVYSLSTIDGKITWSISGASGFKPVAVYTGNIGTQMPVAGAGLNVGSIVGAITNTAVSLISIGGGLATANPMLVAGGAGGLAHSSASLIGASQISYGGSGSIGGRGAKEINSQITVVRLCYQTSDFGANVKDVIGRPYFSRDVIGSCSGLVKCTGANIKCSATELEHSKLAQFVNCSENYIYGGIIVE